MSETVTVTVGRVALRFTYAADDPEHVLVSSSAPIDSMLTPEQLRILSSSIGMLARNLGA